MNSKSFRKACAAALTAAFVMNSTAFGSVLSAGAADEIYEFEAGTVTGSAAVQSQGSERYSKGASGDSFVFIEKGGDTASVTVNAESTGMYEIILCYSAPFGSKVQNISVNGIDQGQISCEETDEGEWVEVSIGSVKLNKGENEIAVVSSWGWTDLDYIKVKTAELPTISASQTTPCDASATKETQSLMAYLASVYGNHIISGQQEIYQHGPHGLEYEFEYLEKLTGHMPAIRGFDYGNFTCPCYGSDDGSTDRIIDWVKNKNGIATASWHLNVPTDFASYTIGSKLDWAATTYSEKTDFSPSKAATEGTKENEYLMQSLTVLAEQFKTLQAEGIPVIWRPYHEAEGGGGETGSWFWWGREGSEAYKKLYIYTYKVLTEDFGCHNLIWEWNSYNYATSANWYPGDAYVDIIGYDKYNCTQYLEENDWKPSVSHNDSAISSTFYGIMEKYDNKKMISMAENDCFSTVDNLTSEKAGWLYFLTWYDGGSEDINFLTNPVFNTEKDTIDMYQSEYCITLDELPADLYSSEIEIIPTQPTTAVPTQPTTEEKTQPTTEDDPDKNYGKVTASKGKYNIELPEAPGDELYLTLSLDKTLGYANGCIGTSVEIDGEFYWVAAKWEANASGDVKMNLNEIYNVTLGDDPVEDEEIIAQATELFKQQTKFEGQVWWASDKAGEESDTALAAIDGAYIMKNEQADILYGDANGDGEVNISDVIAVMCFTSKKESNELNNPEAADVYERGDGINASDAVSIQKFLAKLVIDLPESFIPPIS